MKREEAIELLEDLDGAIEDNHGRDYDEAFRMAIEALSESEPNINETNASIIADALRYYAHNEELQFIERVKAVVLMAEFLHWGSQTKCKDEEKMNELIRRKDVIDVVCKDWCSNKKGDDVCGRCEDVQLILAIPPAEPYKEDGEA